MSCPQQQGVGLTRLCLRWQQRSSGIGCRGGVVSLWHADGGMFGCPGAFLSVSLGVDLLRLSMFVIPAVMMGTVAGAVFMGSAGSSIVCQVLGSGLSIFPRFVVEAWHRSLRTDFASSCRWGSWAGRVPLRFGTLVGDEVGRVAVVRFEARFVSVWPSDSTPKIAGSHCSAFWQHVCAVH